MTSSSLCTMSQHALAHLYAGPIGLLAVQLSLVLGCADLTELEDAPTKSALTAHEDPRVVRDRADQLTQENNSQCVSDEIACEQTCFYEHGQTLGTLSPFYNSCMSRCDEELTRCLQTVKVILPHKTEEVTYSWDQPPSRGIKGYYGYCGPTAAANLVTNLCGHRITPLTFADESFGWGPGTSPRALSHALNELGRCGEWDLCQQDPSRVNIFEELRADLPSAALITWSAGELHWITVVEINFSPTCEVVYNHWGGQATMECDDFLKRWSLTETKLGQTTLVTRLVQPFTYVCQVASQGECEPQDSGCAP